MNDKAINKEYLVKQLKAFDKEILAKEYQPIKKASNSWQSLTALDSSIERGTNYICQIRPSSSWKIEGKIKIYTINNPSCAEDIHFNIGGNIYGEVSYFNRDIIKTNDAIEEPLSDLIFAKNNLGEPHLLGLHFGPTFASGHSVALELNAINECEIIFLDGMIFEDISDSYTIKKYGTKYKGSYGYAEKLNGTLTIGEQVFDGSTDVIVPIYDGK